MRKSSQMTDDNKLRRMLGPAFASYEPLLSYGCKGELREWLLEVGEGSRQLAYRRNPPGKRYLHPRDSHELMLKGMSLREARARLTKLDNAVTRLVARPR
jgi:hypothetical protein